MLTVRVHIEPATKLCRGCNVVRPLAEFYQNKRDGHVARCKECLRPQMLKRYHDRIAAEPGFKARRAAEALARYHAKRDAELEAEAAASEARA